MVCDIIQNDFTSCRLIISKDLFAIGIYIDFGKQAYVYRKPLVHFEINLICIRFWYIKYKK